MLVWIDISHFHLLTDTDPLVKEYDLLFRGESLQWICNLDIDLKFDDLAQLAHRDVITHVEPEKELAKEFLILDHLRIDWLNHHC